MVSAIALLQELGFTEQEARAYQALLQHNPVTGYELAKVSGIPRPNIYPVLQKLEARGAALRIAGDEIARYVPAPPEEFLQRIDEQFQATLDAAGSALRQVARPPAADLIWHTQGYANLLAQARHLIGSANAELLIALWPQEAGALVGDLAAAEAQGCQVTTLCLAACSQECGGCRGRIFRNKVVETAGARWLLGVAGGREMVAGEIGARNHVTGALPAEEAVAVVRTRQPLLVKMTSWFIRHAIILGVLLRDAGDILDDRLAPATLAVLAEAGSPGATNWLDAMRQMLRSGGDQA